MENNLINKKRERRLILILSYCIMIELEVFIGLGEPTPNMIRERIFKKTWKWAYRYAWLKMKEIHINLAKIVNW